MNFTEVKEIPEKRRYTPKGALRDRLGEFMKMNIKIARLDNHGYKTHKLAYSAFYKAVEKWVFPIDVIMRDGDVYLIRRDM